MKTLQIASDLALPVDAVTQVLAFLGRRGNGKTYAAQKLCELMLDAQAQVVALDPVGNWWGLRLAADGKSKGYPVPVFGGLHADVPLEPSAGALVADLIVDRDLSAIVDVSQFVLDEQTRFAYDFATRLFQRKKAEPSAIHLFVEECQEFIPETMAGGDKFESKMLQAFARMVKLGRNYGIGNSLISQRPQEVNKRVLNMTEGLFVFQMNGKLEREAIRNWVRTQGMDENIVETLPTLERGEPYVWSPQWLRSFGRHRILRKKTFDASATPEVGAKTVTPKHLSPVDVEQLTEAMAATIARAKESDPEELRRRIAQLEGEVRRAQTALPRAVAEAAVRVERVEVPVVAPAELKRIEGAIRDVDKIVSRAAELYEKTAGLFTGLDEARAALAAEAAHLREALARAEGPPPADTRRASTVARRPAAAATHQPAGHARARRDAPATPPADGELSKPQQRVLDALAAFENLGVFQVRRVNAAFFAGYTENGHFNNVVGSLNTAGLIEYPQGGYLGLTPEGRARARADAHEIGSLMELHQAWLNKLKEPQRRILRVLLDIYPEAISREDLAGRTGYTVNGHFNNTVGSLRTLGAADYPRGNYVAATEVLFPEGLS